MLLSSAVKHGRRSSPGRMLPSQEIPPALLLPRSLVVLRNPHRVVISRGQEFLKVSLDVVPDVQLRAKLNHPVGVILPIRCAGDLLQVVGASDFEEVHEPMCSFDNRKAGLYINGWLQADPGEDATIVKCLKRSDAV